MVVRRVMRPLTSPLLEASINAGNEIPGVIFESNMQRSVDISRVAHISVPPSILPPKHRGQRLRRYSVGLLRLSLSEGGDLVISFPKFFVIDSPEGGGC